MSELRCRCRAAGKWTLKEESPKYAPDRTCDVTHLKVEIEPDLPRHAIRARATLTLAPSYGAFDTVRLDAVDLEVSSIRDGRGRDLTYTYLEDRIIVRFPRPVAATQELVIEYRKERPVRGLYFWGPTEWAPKRAWQMWSQGEDEEARHWIPCHDAPHEKMTTEMIVTVPGEYTVLSNGALRGVREQGRKKTWHFFESVPHPSYLITLVVGVFVKLEDDCDGLPVEYYVEPGREEEARRSFGQTPEMIRCFAELLACPYPYEKYAQVAVRHFTFGGMENTSATTQTDGTLHDEAAALDFSSVGLVAHELAHQWFGDLITCKHWAHAWLNEGFATYFECIWREHGETFADFEKNLIDDADTYLAEPYRRAVVNHRFAYPFQVFDMHIYPKGGWILHMLRRHVGDELFWKAVRLYVRRHAAGSVETIDLLRAFEDATGRNLEGFFQQWLYSPGHPELEGSIQWNDENSMLEIRLEQKQKAEDGAPVFRIPVEIEAVVDSGARHVRVFEMSLREQTFYLPLPAKPVAVVLDPNARVLKTLKLEIPTEWVHGALLGKHRDSRVFARTEWVRQSVRNASARTAKMLGEVLRKDPFWSVQAEAAKSLGQIGTPAARDELLRSIGARNAKVRRAVIAALATFREEDVVRALRAKIEEGDPGYHVRMEALAAYGKSAGMAAAPLLKKELAAAMKRRDWHDLIAVGAVQGLAAARDESAVDAMLGLAGDPSRYWGSRLSAFEALAELGAARPHLAPRISDAMEPYLGDPELLVAYRVPAAFGQLAYAGAIPLLQARARSAAIEEQREACLRAIEAIVASEKSGGQVDRLQSELRKLEEESRTLRDRLDRLETTEERRGKSSGRPRRSRTAAQ